MDNDTAALVHDLRTKSTNGNMIAGMVMNQAADALTAQAAEIAALKMCSDEAEREVAALRAALAAAEARVAVLEEALRTVKSSIENGGGGGVTCVVWCDGPCPETVCDHIETALKGGAA